LITHNLDKKHKKVYCFFNSFFGVAGGEIRFAEIFKRTPYFDKIIITPALGEQFLCEKGLHASYVQTTKEGKLSNVMLTYLKRIISVFNSKIIINDDDIIYTTSDFLPDTLPALYFSMKNKKTKWVANIYHIIPPPIQRGGPFIRNFVSFITQRISLQFIKYNSDLIFVLNNGIVEQLVKSGFQRDRIHVIGAGINLTHIHNIPQDKVKYDACFLGRLHSSKGIFDLIDIWKTVVSKNNLAKLAIIYTGQSEIESTLIKKLKKENLNNNISMLPLTGDKAMHSVKCSKIFIFPSHEEGWGIAMCEAMACGLPVVAYDLPVYREIFTQGVITVKLKDIQRFSEVITDLLNNEQKRVTLGKEAEVQASKYDWSDVASKERIYIEKLTSTPHQMLKIKKAIALEA
jgi:glycosyltransferase involved in cell wall biosynthesis